MVLKRILIMDPITLGLLVSGALLLFGRSARGDVPLTKVGGYTDVFDDVYRQECKSIPVAYLRSLAKHESDSNPAETTGGAWGLLQVWWAVPGSVLIDYNERKGTAFTKNDLLDPYINARLACELLSRIKNYYGYMYRRAFPNPSWSDRRFVEVVTMGWNVGWSHERGVGRVVSVLLGEGHTTDIDVAMIRQRAGGLPEVTDKARGFLPVSFARRVTSAYFTIAGQA